MSAFTTPTSVTLGKSSPLAIICVPRRMCVVPSRNESSTRRWLPGLLIVSESIRWTTLSGNFSSISACNFSVPNPWYRTESWPHCGHLSTGADSQPQ